MCFGDKNTANMWMIVYENPQGTFKVHIQNLLLINKYMMKYDSLKL